MHTVTSLPFYMNILVIVLIKLFQIVVFPHQHLDPTIISTVQSQLSELYLPGITFKIQIGTN